MNTNHLKTARGQDNACPKAVAVTATSHDPETVLLIDWAEQRGLKVQFIGDTISVKDPAGGEASVTIPMTPEMEKPFLEVCLMNSFRSYSFQCLADACDKFILADQNFGWWSGEHAFRADVSRNLKHQNRLRLVITDLNDKAWLFKLGEVPEAHSVSVHSNSVWYDTWPPADIFAQQVQQTIDEYHLLTRFQAYLVSKKIEWEFFEYCLALFSTIVTVDAGTLKIDGEQIADAADIAVAEKIVEEFIVYDKTRSTMLGLPDVRCAGFSSDVELL